MATQKPALNGAKGFIWPDAPDYAAIHRCIRCGMCLPHCPTYRELGVEMDSPRGRIALIRAAADGRLAVSDSLLVKHLYQCLDCRACETACPAGVRFGYLLERARGQIEQGHPRPVHVRLLRSLIFDQLFPFPARLRRLAALLRLYQRSGVQALVRRSGILKLLPGNLDWMEAMLPSLPSHFFDVTNPESLYEKSRLEVRSHDLSRSQPVHSAQAMTKVVTPNVVPSGNPKTTVAFFAGCVQSLVFAEVNRATVRVLERHGCRVLVPAGQVCCGALHVHAGERDGARALARQNLAAFDPDQVDAIVVNAAGCSAMLKAYEDLFHADPVYASRAKKFVSKVKDVHEFLVGLPWVPPSTLEGQLRVTYQDACHLLHAQGIKEAPRSLLRRIPGIQLVEMAEPDWCCGSAGIYNLTQPTLSNQILARKVAHIAATGADVVAVGNTGCLLQLQQGIEQAGLKIRVAHPMELLDEAYGK